MWCLALDRDLLILWPEIRISPFGAVDKVGGDPVTTGRTTHDLSFLDGASINDCMDKGGIGRPEYKHCGAVTSEILRVKEENPDEDAYLLAGDVASAFRHASIHFSCVHFFAGLTPEDTALVIELSAPFGWTGSPGSYEILAGTISYSHGLSANTSNSEDFFNHHWVDDHALVATDHRANKADVELSLRASVLNILGHGSINEEKFSGWHTILKVLELVFDSRALTVSTPAMKVSTAQALVFSVFHAPSLSRTEYRSLLGSLRHVSTCIRPARIFLQRLQQRVARLHRFQRVHGTEGVRADLHWWWFILQSPKLNAIPLNFFYLLPNPDVTIEMDASDVGLCAMDLTFRSYVTGTYSMEEIDFLGKFKAGEKNGFDINSRELMSCTFSVVCWGHRWQMLHPDRVTHVHFRIDNSSAVAWQTKMSSRNPRAQVVLRLLSLWEHELGVRFSSFHIFGSANVDADLGNAPAGHLGFRSDLAGYLHVHSVASSTLSKYSSSLKQWGAWTSRHAISPWLHGLPESAQRDVLLAFTTDAFQFGFSSCRLVSHAMIVNTLNGTRHFFSTKGIRFPLHHQHIPIFLKGIGRFNSSRQRKAPVSVALLEECLAALDFAHPLDKALWGLCVSPSSSSYDARRSRPPANLGPGGSPSRLKT